MIDHGHPELGEPRWLPLGDQALAVRVHRPQTEDVQRIIVLAPPFGREQVVSTRTLRVLAIRAARDHRALVLRPSWSGTGDSTGELPADPAADWCRDLIALIRAGRRLVPGVPVTVIGLRLGAAVAARARDHADAAERTILWEPVAGRRFLREQQALRRITQSQATAAEGVELPGVLLDEDQAASLRGLRMPSEDGPAAPGALAEVLSAPPEQRAEIERVYGIAYRDAEVPLATVDDVIRRAVAGPADLRAAPAEAGADAAPARDGAVEPDEGLEQALAQWPTAWESPAPDGTPIRHEFLRIGPHALPGVLTAPASGPRASSSALNGRGYSGLLLVAAAAEPMDGPTGMWARAARDLAAEGITVLRADRRGIAEAGEPDALTEPMPYTEEGVQDVRAAIEELRRRVTGPVRGAGLCAGSWLVLRCAERRLDEALLISPVAWARDGDYFWRSYRDGRVLRVLGGRTAMRADPTSWRSRVKDVLRMARDALRRAVPSPVRRGLARCGVMQSLGEQFTDPRTMPPVTIVLGHGDQEAFRVAGGAREVRRLRSRGFRLHLEPPLDIDHALLTSSSRDRVMALLHRFATA